MLIKKGNTVEIGVINRDIFGLSILFLAHRNCYLKNPILRQIFWRIGFFDRFTRDSRVSHTSILPVVLLASRNTLYVNKLVRRAHSQCYS